MKRISINNLVYMFPAFLAMSALAALSGCGSSDVAVQMEDGTYLLTEEDWESEDGWEFTEEYVAEDGWESTETEETWEGDDGVEAEEAETEDTWDHPVEPVTEETASEEHEIVRNELDMTLMHAIQDSDMEGMARDLEDEPFFHMFSFISTMSDEHCESIDFEDACAEDMLDAPDDYRGAPVKLEGEVVWLQKKSMAAAAKPYDGPSYAFHGLLKDEDGNFCYFLTLDPPEWLAPESEASVYGFFLRNYAYRTKSQKMHTTPVVLVKYFQED